MARRIVSITTLTPTAFGDTTNLTDATYVGILQGGGSIQLNKLWEISLNGQAASSSSPTFMLWSRDSQAATGSNTFGTGQMDAAMDASTAALALPPVTGNSNATNKPQRSSTLHLMNCSLNAFGGVFFWRANRIEECPTVYGNGTIVGPAAALGQCSLSAFTGGTPGAIGAHYIYEPS